MPRSTYFTPCEELDRPFDNHRFVFVAAFVLAAAVPLSPAQAQEEVESQPSEAAAPELPPQEQAAPAPSPKKTMESEATEEIVITGSRILRRDFTSPSPVSTVSNEQIQLSGTVTLEQVMNELPQLQANNTSNVNAPGGAGTLTVDLRALGASRTLVLVNGRRFAPAEPSGVVDLASIPQALVERVEVVTGGASAVYGSDAIAGVVNFILKDNFQGAQASYGYGITQRGDGDTHNADVAIGGNFGDGRGNAVLYASYTNQKPIFQADRTFSKTALFEDQGELVPGGSSRVPGTVVFGSDLVYPDGAPAADCTNPSGTQFREGGLPTPYCSIENAYNFAAPNYLLRPRSRWQIAGTSHYDITDTIRAFGEIVYLNTQNNLQQAPAAVDFELVKGSRELPVPLNNPLLPAETRNFLAANFDADGDGIATLVGSRRRFEETGPRRQLYDRNSFQVVGGLDGKLLTYDWTLFYQFAHTSTEEELVNQVSNLRVAQGLDVVVEDGTTRCRNETFGCVPVNIFGYDSITPEAAAFLTPLAVTRTMSDRHVIGGSLAGDVVALPGGPLGGALGFEYRTEEARFQPDATVISGELGGTGYDSLPLSGDFDVWEMFAEARIPVFSEMPFFEYLGLEAAARFANYSNVGSVWTFKAGGEWAPFQDVRVRGLYQRAVRAPNLFELYQGQSSGAMAYNDPCDVDRTPSEEVRQFCVAQGVPADVLDNFQQDDVVFGISGGNPNLQEERSDTYTIGMVVQPEALPGLSATVDYYSIEVDDAITSVAVQTILDLCFTSLNLDNPYCQRIQRISNGRISRIESFNANIANLSVRGLDVAADYRFELPSSLGLAGNAAKLAARVLASWQFERTFIPDPTSEPTDCAGYFGDGLCSGQGIPIILDFKGMVGVDYRSGPLGVSLQGRYLGKVRPLSDDNVIDEISPHFYTDVALSYQIIENLEVSAVVDNVFDADPPVLGFDNAGDTNTDPAVYDVLGRRFFASLRARY